MTGQATSLETASTRPPMFAAPPQSIAVICLRRLGDVLLTAPLLRSLRRAYPKASIEALVFAGTEGVLAGNPDVDAVIALPARGGLRQLWPLRRSYEIAVCTQSSDRPQLIAFWIARRRVGIVPPAGAPGARWKRGLSARWAELPQGDTHTVVQYLLLAEALGIPALRSGAPPRSVDGSAIAARLGADWSQANYAVIHPAPKFRYKAWTDAGWQALIGWLRGRGLQVVITGSAEAGEVEYAESLARAAADPGVRSGVRNLAGALQFGDLTRLIEHAQVFIGPDTSVTHLAAMTGVRTVALFGPSNPRVWGPWPAAAVPDAATPWREKAPLQRCGNVWLLQGLGACVPCFQEGCLRRLGSPSACLDAMAPARVIATVAEALASVRAG